MWRVLLVLLLLTSPAWGQDLVEPTTDDPANQTNGNAWYIEGGVNITTAYYDRGHFQENQGFIGQPGVEGGVRFGNFEVFGGTWNSLHSNPDDLWYENDIYVGARFYTGSDGNIVLSGEYRWYESPEDYFDNLEDIGIGVALQNDGILGDIDLNPFVKAYFETEGALDGIGDGKGILLTFGVIPVFPLAESDVGKLSLRTPVVVGIGIKDYYEAPTTTSGPTTLASLASGTDEGNGGLSDSSSLGVDDEDFGYVDAGVEVVLNHGNMEFFAGGHYIWLGDNNLADNGDDWDIYGICGFRILFGNQ